MSKIKTNSNHKSTYNRKNAHLLISYISQPQLSRYAQSYANYSNERYLYLYAYTINKNGKRSSNDLSYHAYNDKCDMSTRRIKDFTKYIKNNFNPGDVVNARVVEWEKDGKSHRMITKIYPTQQNSSNKSDAMVLRTVNEAMQKMQ